MTQPAPQPSAPEWLTQERVAVFDSMGRLTECSPGFAQLLGQPGSQLLGRAHAELLLPPGSSTPSVVHQAQRTGRVTLQPLCFGGRRFQAIAHPLRAPDGEPAPVAVALLALEAEPVWCRRSAEGEDWRQDSRTQAFLAEASSLLTSSLDSQQTVRNLAQLAVPYLADLCVVNMLQPDGALHPMAVAHANPERLELAREIERLPPVNPHELAKDSHALWTGKVELVERLPERPPSRIALGERHLELMRLLGPKSYLRIPLLVRGRTLGTFTLVHTESGRCFSPADVPLAEDFARRAALGLENARLYEESQAATQQARRLITALERSNRDLDQFAYVASHDLKAPLRGIANLSQWIEDDLQGVMTEETREQMKLLRGRVNRMEALINGILDYSRAGRKRARPERVDVGQLLAECIELLAPAQEASFQVETPMPTLHTERVLLQQLFLNLLNNALKHAQRADVQVRVRAREVGELWEFAVADNGPGIAPEFHERIWGLFQTLRSRDEVEGAGIGLSVVKRSVEARGGQAWLESSPGQGATFFFTWPKEPPEESPC